MFVDRVKNDPAFARAAFKLQKDIKEASDPINHANTYFSVNDNLTLDTRTKGEDSRFTDAELEGLKGHEVSADFKQQRDSDHPRYQEVRVIAQTLAFGECGAKDVVRVCELLNEGYNRAECEGEEGYRDGDVLDEGIMRDMVRDKGVRVMVAEVPDGKEVVRDGSVIGCCVYSVGEEAGCIEGSENGGVKIGAIRMLVVKPQFQGLCVGERVLRKAERNMAKEGVGKVVGCVPSCRRRMVEWMERRGYQRVAKAPYPCEQVPFQVWKDRRDGLELHVMEKILAEREGGGEEGEGGRKEVRDGAGETTAYYTIDI